MAKPYGGDWVLRTVLFVPGHIDKMLNKGAASDADCVVLDLEDAVPPGSKAEARQKIRRALEEDLFERRPVFVRVNPISTGLTLLDVNAVACSALDGFVYPMAHTPENIGNFDAQLSLIEANLGLGKGYFSIMPLIETPLGVLNAGAIATASPRVVSLIFGCEDYLAEMQARHSDQDISLHTPRSLVALAARAAGLEPVDTPYVKVHDTEGFREFATRGRDLGMGGILVMTPSQIEVARRVYEPTSEEMDTAREIVEAQEKALKEGLGITVSKGRFISPPTLKAARALLRRAEAIKALEDFKGGNGGKRSSLGEPLPQ